MGPQSVGEQPPQTMLCLLFEGMQYLAGSGDLRISIRRAKKATALAGLRAAHPAEVGQAQTLMTIRRVTTAGKILAEQRSSPGQLWREMRLKIRVKSMSLHLLAGEGLIWRLLLSSAMRIMSPNLPADEGVQRRFRLQAPALPRGRGALKHRRYGGRLFK